MQLERTDGQRVPGRLAGAVDDVQAQTTGAVREDLPAGRDSFLATIDGSHSQRGT